MLPRPVKILAVVLAILFLASSAGMLYLRLAPAGPRISTATAPASTDPLSPEPRVGELAVPEFTLPAADGRTITRADFTGRVTVIAFMFTHCPLICPTLTQEMSKLRTALDSVDAVRFLSISVDPAHDTPERLKQYAAEHAIDGQRWAIAGATTKQIAQFASALKFEIGPDPKFKIPLPTGGTMDNIVHPSWFVLVGPDARVLDIFQASNPAEMDRLRQRAGAAAKALKAAKR